MKSARQKRQEIIRRAHAAAAELVMGDRPPDYGDLVTAATLLVVAGRRMEEELVFLREAVRLQAERPAGGGQ